MKSIMLLIVSLCLIISFTQCSSTPAEVQEIPEATDEPSPPPDKVEKFNISGLAASVEVLGDGLSPNDDGFKDTIAFRISVEEKDKIVSWKLGMNHTKSNKIQKEVSGTKAPPESIKWDGKGENGISPEGSYTAILTLEYENADMVKKVVSESFILDISPPQVNLDAAPVPFSPDGDGINDTITISFSINDISPVYKWEMKMYDEDNELFHSFAGAGETNKKIIWDGMNDAGHFVEIARDYRLVLTVTDEFVNTSTVEKIIPVDVLLVKITDKKYRIKIGNIIFKAYKSDYKEGETEILRGNMNSFEQIARVMKKYSEYTILIEGHAMMPKSKIKNKKEFDRYNKEVLIPLSKSRAEAIKKALIGLGVKNRIITDGLGASGPSIPHDDLKNSWMNRRVEFYLLKD